MEMIKIESTNIESIGYKKEAHLNKCGTLRIVFQHGGIYDYKNVPNNIWEEFLKVSSKGSFFHRKILNNFHSTKVNNDEN